MAFYKECGNCKSFEPSKDLKIYFYCNGICNNIDSDVYNKEISSLSSCPLYELKEELA